jgi:hypothetical protein
VAASSDIPHELHGRCRSHLRNPRALASDGRRDRRRDRCGPGVRARQPIFATVTQENTPPHLLGRVFGALTAIAQAAVPIGAVVAGVAVQRVGLSPTIVGMGVVYVVVMIGMFFKPGASGDGCPPRAGRRTDGRTSGSSE